MLVVNNVLLPPPRPHESLAAPSAAHGRWAFLRAAISRYGLTARQALPPRTCKDSERRAQWQEKRKVFWCAIAKPHPIFVKQRYKIIGKRTAIIAGKAMFCAVAATGTAWKQNLPVELAAGRPLSKTVNEP